MKPLQQRLVLGFSSAFRFLKDGNWRKGCDGLELGSSASGAVFRFNSDNELILLSTLYTPVRVVVVVKQFDDDGEGVNEVFSEKLLLATSPQLHRMVVATDLDRRFNKNEQVF